MSSTQVTLFSRSKEAIKDWFSIMGSVITKMITETTLVTTMIIRWLTRLLSSVEVARIKVNVLGQRQRLPAHAPPKKPRDPRLCSNSQMRKIGGSLITAIVSNNCRKKKLITWSLKSQRLLRGPITTVISSSSHLVASKLAWPRTQAVEISRFTRSSKVPSLPKT